ncbi:alpha/beta fold hydrolase [Niabella aquatica]
MIDQMPAYFKENFLKLNPDESLLKNMFYKDSQRMIHFRDWEDSALASIAAPAFFIAGDKDVITAAHIAAMGKMVPDSRLMILPCGHGTYMMADETGVTDSDLIDFTMSQIRKFVNS